MPHLNRSALDTFKKPAKFNIDMGRAQTVNLGSLLQRTVAGHNTSFTGILSLFGFSRTGRIHGSSPVYDTSHFNANYWQSIVDTDFSDTTKLIKAEIIAHLYVIWKSSMKGRSYYVWKDVVAVYNSLKRTPTHLWPNVLCFEKDAPKRTYLSFIKKAS